MNLHSQTLPSYQRRGWIGAAPTRASFTLIELLVVISLISILSAMVLLAMSGARRDAEIAKTRSTIRKISQVILSQYENFQSRAMPIEIPPEYLRPRNDGPVAQPVYYPIAASELSRVRLIALRDMMRLEMPDRANDFATPTPILVEGTIQGSRILLPIILGVPGSPVQASIARQLTTPALPLWSTSNADAELLYLIVSLGAADGQSGLEDFHPSEIGDTDGDGHPEFIDSWGRAIRFIRWPAGAYNWSPIAFDAKRREVVDDTGGDVFDPTRSDWRFSDDLPGTTAAAVASRNNNPFALTPLIVSAGPDGIFGLVFDGGDIGQTAVDYRNMPYPRLSDDPYPAGHVHGAQYRYPDPYFRFTTAGEQLGQNLNLVDHDDNVSNLDPVTE